MYILILNGHDSCGNEGAYNPKYGSEQELTRSFSVDLAKALISCGAKVDIYNKEISDKSMYSHLVSGGKYNFSDYDYVIEIHFNACVKDYKGNGKITGTEILVHSRDIDTGTASIILNKLQEVGLLSRGVKKRSELTVMNQCYIQGVPYLLWEVCFLDDADDMKFFLRNRELIAATFANALMLGGNGNLVGKVNTNDGTPLNIRSSRSLESDNNIVGSIPNKTTIVYQNTNHSSWLRVSYNGVKGYIVSRFVDKIMKGRVKTSEDVTLRVRSGPSTSCNVITRLSHGDSVFIFDLCEWQGKVWYCVGLDCMEPIGYCRGDYIDIN